MQTNVMELYEKTPKLGQSKWYGKCGQNHESPHRKKGEVYETNLIASFQTMETINHHPTKYLMYAKNKKKSGNNISDAYSKEIYIEIHKQCESKGNY